MRNKTAKLLRRKSEALTEGVPNKQYNRQRHYKDQLKLEKGCTRWVYKRLKKHYKTHHEIGDFCIENSS